MPDPGEVEAAKPGTGEPAGTGAALGTDAQPRSRKAERAAARDVRRAAKAAAKAAARAARKAGRAAAKDARRAAKAASREARRAAKASAKSAKATAKADRAAAKAAKLAAKPGVGVAEPSAKAGAEAANPDRAAATATADEVPRSTAAKARTRAARPAAAAASDGPTTPAGAVLEEVAGLVRQASEPATARILERAPAVPAPEAEPVPAFDQQAEPEVEPRTDAAPAPEPEPEAEPEPTASWSTADTSSWVPVAIDRPAPAENEPAALGAGEAGEAAPAPESIAIPEGAIVQAAIDVGATSVHLLVAAVHGRRVIPILDESVFLGLGDRVAADGRIGPDAREELVAALVAYAERARELGTRDVTIVGTEPMRRAADAAGAVRAVEARASASFHVIDHDEEGQLTYLGVTLGRPHASSVLVIDVGGGSTELVGVDRDGVVRAVGLPLGAARLTRDLVRSDPPTLPELGALRARVREVLEGAPAVEPGTIVGVGGTVSNLLRLPPATADDRVLTRRRLTVALAMLTVERSAEAAERHLVRPERARILPAGSIIVDGILERYGVDRMRVSEDGLREGLALAVATAGPAWRDRLPVLARGWEDARVPEPATSGDRTGRG